MFAWLYVVIRSSICQSRWNLAWKITPLARNYMPILAQIWDGVGTGAPKVEKFDKNHGFPGHLSYSPLLFLLFSPSHPSTFPFLYHLPVSFSSPFPALPLPLFPSFPFPLFLIPCSFPSLPSLPFLPPFSTEQGERCISMLLVLRRLGSLHRFF